MIDLFKQRRELVLVYYHHPRLFTNFVEESNAGRKMLKDRYGRSLNYLRMAVTDKCNLRCRYCMPEKGLKFLNNKNLLSSDEIVQICELFSRHGVDKIRITGGEPFVRHDLPMIIERIAPLFRSVNVTTNATLIEDHIDTLRIPNIGSLNISLDSQDPLTFLAITKRDSFDRVWGNIMTCYNAGIRIKINMVVMKDINDHEIPAFLELARKYNMDVRFIEAMPFNEYDENEGLLMDYISILQRIESCYPKVRQIRSVPEKSASLKYEIPGFKGNVGIIPAYSRTICGNCNRIRLTADGQLMNCLYATKGMSVRDLIRNGESNEVIMTEVRSYLHDKPRDGFEAEDQRVETEGFQSMTRIGG
ncbi:MAG: GTP 3',8-cyclase MoaA [Saprospiraceae bacterium]|nr:GTP 3',8-cyclase MoaA [Saprospiraceae bacterium]